MEKNVKIAKELIRIAKMMVAEQSDIEKAKDLNISLSAMKWLLKSGDNEILLALLKNPRTSERNKKAIVNDIVNNIDSAKDSELLELMEDSHTSNRNVSIIIDYLIDSGEKETRLALVNHPKITESQLDALALDNDEEVSDAALNRLDPQNDDKDFFDDDDDDDDDNEGFEDLDDDEDI